MKKVLIGITAVAALIGLSGCGTTGESSAGGAGSITVTDGTGQKVTISGPATRVVTLEWNNTEDVITLGVQPVGIADVKGYASWGTISPVTGDPVDVGVRSEPNLEAVASAEPDLILGIIGSIPDSAMEQMEKIAPVVLLKPADAADPIGLMEANFETTAKLLGKEQRATEVLAELDQTITDDSAAIEKSIGAGVPLAFTYIYEDGNNFAARVHGPGSMPIALAQKIGFTPASTDAGDAEYGLSTLDLEGFSTLPASTMMTYWTNSETESPIVALSGNALWTSLPFVQAGNVFPAADGIWVYGGPASAMAWLNQLVELAGKYTPVS